MRKILILLSLSVVVSMTLLSSIAHAQQAIPETTNCTPLCTSYGWWNGTAYGGYTYTVVSNPTIRDSSGHWDRLLRMQSTGGYPRIEVGETVIKSETSNTSAYCGGNPDGLYYFYYSWSSSGVLNMENCDGSNSNDINGGLQLELVEATLGDGCYADGDEWWALYVANTSSNTICQDTEMGAGSERITLVEHVKDHVTLHEVWGVSWTENQWQNNAGTWSFQKRDFDVRSPANPPQFYWQAIPNSVNSGGDLRSCVYDGGTTCTLGSSPTFPAGAGPIKPIRSAPTPVPTQ